MRKTRSCWRSAAILAALAPSLALAAPVELKVHAVDIPGATGPVSIDYIAVDRDRGEVWIPAGDTGSVDVYDIKTKTMKRINGFRTAEREMHGKKHLAGPSSVALSAATAYIGSRATREICAVDRATMKIATCESVGASPDGLAWVDATQELWINTPAEKSIVIWDAAMKPKGKVALEGQPESNAVDNATGRFYTNLEDKNQSLTIDVRSRKVIANVGNGCGEAGPRGVAVEPTCVMAGGEAQVQTGGRWILVGCTDHAAVVDATSGKVVGTFDTGAGVDNIDFLPAKGAIYVASGKAGMLHLLTVDKGGKITETATAKTAEGVRTVVVDADGVAYMPDPKHGKLLIAEQAK